MEPIAAVLVAVFGLVGVVAGSLLTARSSARLVEAQERIANERVERERLEQHSGAKRALGMSASVRILEAVHRLQAKPSLMEVHQGVYPPGFVPPDSVVPVLAGRNDVAERAWHQYERDAWLTIEVSAHDLPDSALRARIDDAAMIYQHALTVERWGVQSESSVRHGTLRDVLVCVGAFRRGDVLPDKPGWYKDASAAIDEEYVDQR